MDYKFYRDIDGKALAECEPEASTFSDWLSNELGNNSAKVSDLLSTIDLLQAAKLKNHKMKGHEYTLILDQDEAELHSHLGYWDEDMALPEGTELDQQTAIGCGLQDLKELLIDWHEFIS